MPRLPSRTIGLGIGVDSVRAVSMRNDRVVWYKELAVDAGGPIAPTIDALFDAVPRSTTVPTRVVAAVGPSRSQLRRMEGLPAIQDTAVLAALIAQHPGRFFLDTDTQLCTTGVERLDDDTIWAGAIERSVVDDVTESCRRHGLRLAGVLPTAAALAHVYADGPATWRDGHVTLEIVSAKGGLQSCRRIWSVETNRNPDVATPMEESPREWDASRFADAIGAGRSNGTPLAHRPARRDLGLSVSRPRMLAAATACALGLGFGTLAPSLVASRDEHAARRELALLGASADEALRTERSLATSGATLHELDAFVHGSRSMTLVLADLTRAIPAPTMLVNIRLDSAGGTFVTLTPSPSDVLDALHSITAIVEPRIVGTVTPERAPVIPVTPQPGSAPAEPPPMLQRMTIRFDWAGATHVPRARGTT